MKLESILRNLVADANRKAPAELTKKENYNIELLEQRIMYSATQLGAALGADGFDLAQVEDICAGHAGIQELFGQFDNNIESGKIDQLVGDLLGQQGRDGVVQDAGVVNVGGDAGDGVIVQDQGDQSRAVSYTHLTLPTKRIV